MPRVLLLLLVAGLVPAAVLLAAAGDWSVVTNDAEFTNVADGNRRWEFAANPDRVVANGWRLAVRRPRNVARQPAGPAAVTIERRLRSPAQADLVRVVFFGRGTETVNRPNGELLAYVFCVSETPGDSDWVQVGSTSVVPAYTAQALEAPITVDDCPTQTIDAVRIQLEGATRRRDFRWRTVFLTSAQLKLGGTTLYDDNFTVP
jgi:hypothetical protein